MGLAEDVVAHEADGMVREYDGDSGEVVWDNQGLAKGLEPIATRSSTAKTADELVA